METKTSSKTMAMVGTSQFYLVCFMHTSKTDLVLDSLANQSSMQSITRQLYMHMVIFPPAIVYIGEYAFPFGS